MNMNIENLCLFYNDVILWIGEMILNNGLRLRDIPPNIRKSSNSIYSFAFRMSRSGSCNRFTSDLQILCEDIISLNNDYKRKAELIAFLSDTLQFNDYKGDKRFETFKKDMDETLLQELHDYKYAHGKQLQAMLRKYCDENGIKFTEKNK